MLSAKPHFVDIIVIFWKTLNTFVLIRLQLKEMVILDITYFVVS